MRNFRELNVWEKSHQLTLALYKSTSEFPQSEKFGLTSQIRRSAASIPANIAEGCVYDSDAQFARFLQNALGSASELEYHLLLAKDLAYLSDDKYENLNQDTTEIKRMLTAFLKKLRADR